MSTEWHFIMDRCKSAFHCFDAIERPTEVHETRSAPFHHAEYRMQCWGTARVLNECLETSYLLKKIIYI